MKKVLIYILLAALTLSLCSCTSEMPNDDDIPLAEESSGDDVLEAESEQQTRKQSTKPQVSDDDFVMTAKILEINDKIKVEVIESEYAAGIYLVNTSVETVFLDADSTAISLADLHVGDTVCIMYGGQVMLSLPPQIIASQITKIG